MTSSTVTKEALPDYAKPYFQKMMRSAEALAGEDYQPYQGQRIAGFEPEQMGAFQGITAVAGRDLPGMRQGRQTAMEMARGMGNVPMVRNRYRPGQVGPLYRSGNLGPLYRAEDAPDTYQSRELGPLYQAEDAPSVYRAEDVGDLYRSGDLGPLYEAGEFREDPIKERMGDYQNPYQEAVLDRLQRRAIERFDEGQTQREMQAAQQGAFGGSRAALQDFTARRDLEERLTDMEAQQLQRGFGESARLAGMDVSQAQRAREAYEAARQRQGMMGLSGFEAQERARQAESQVGLTGYQAQERARQAADQTALTAYQAQERARQAAGQMGLSGFEAQERARQAASQMGLTAYQAQEKARQGEGQMGLSGFEAQERARAAEAQMGLSGFEAQERARQQYGQMGITADTANQRAYEAAMARRLQAAGMLPEMSRAEQSIDLQRLAALRGVGGELQAQRQQMMDQGYQDFINQRDYPRQNLAFFQQLLSGLPVTPSSEVMQFEPRPNPYAQMMNMGLGGMQMMSGMRG